MVITACVKTVLRVMGTVKMAHTLSDGGSLPGAVLTACGRGDSLVITTSAACSGAGDTLVLGG